MEIFIGICVSFVLGYLAGHWQGFGRGECDQLLRDMEATTPGKRDAS